MADGLYIWNAAGVLVFSSDNPFGGAYVGTYFASATGESSGAVTTWTFNGIDKPDIGAGNSLRAVQIGPDRHFWDIVGNQIILTQRAGRVGYWGGTELMVFAI